MERFTSYFFVNIAVITAIDSGCSDETLHIIAAAVAVAVGIVIVQLSLFALWRRSNFIVCKLLKLNQSQLFSSGTEKEKTHPCLPSPRQSQTRVRRLYCTAQIPHISIEHLVRLYICIQYTQLTGWAMNFFGYL